VLVGWKMISVEQHPSSSPAYFANRKNAAAKLSRPTARLSVLPMQAA